MRLTRLLVLVSLTILPVFGKDHFRVCINSEVGTGCSHKRFSQKIAEKIRDLFAGAPIPSDYKVWIEDTRKPPKQVEQTLPVEGSDPNPNKL